MSHSNEEIVPCPMCGRGFPKFQVQEHANHCLDAGGAPPAALATNAPQAPPPRHVDPMQSGTFAHEPSKYAITSPTQHETYAAPAGGVQQQPQQQGAPGGYGYAGYKSPPPEPQQQQRAVQSQPSQQPPVQPTGYPQAQYSAPPQQQQQPQWGAAPAPVSTLNTSSNLSGSTSSTNPASLPTAYMGPPVEEPDPHKKALGFLPQWAAQRVNVYTHQQPQWGDPAPDVASRDVLPPDQQCIDCDKNIKSCKCSACYLCKVTVRMGSRHHCRKCWRTTCGNCRTKSRYLNPSSPMNTNALVCSDCASYKGLPRVLPEDANCDYLGLYLLRQAVDLPLQCVGARCGLKQHQATCTRCSLPTVAVNTHWERCVRVHGKNKDEKKKNEMLMRQEEENRKLAREQSFASLTPAVENQVFEEFGGAMNDADLNLRQEALGVGGNTGFKNKKKKSEQEDADVLDETSGSYAGDKLPLPPFVDADTVTSRRILLSAIASSVCYEYDFFPHTTLALNDFPFARLLRLKQTQQLFSIFEGYTGGKKTIFVALPGTHDLRTAITDVKFARTHEHQKTLLNEGMPPYSSTPNHGGSTTLWDYKVHTGFNTEELKLQKVLPTEVCKKFVQEGYHVVFTGHSLGGALAALCCLRHLGDDVALFKDKVSCVTYGAPLVGNSLLTRKIQRSGFGTYFHHVVCCSDIVPRLLTGRQLMTRDEMQRSKKQVGDAFSNAGQAVRGFFKFGGGDKAASNAPQGQSTGAVGVVHDAADSVQTIFDEEDAPSTNTTGGMDGIEFDPSAYEDPEDDGTASTTTAMSSASAGSSGVNLNPSLVVAAPAGGPLSVDPTKTVDLWYLQQGDKRPFDCYGRYHFLYRDVPYKSTNVPAIAYQTLKGGDGVPVSIAHHLLGTYYKVLTYHFGVEKKRQRERAQSLI